MAYDKTQQQRIDSGLCKDCGKERGIDGTTIYCRVCVSRISKRSYALQKDKRKKLKELGLCPSCGKAPCASDGAVCAPCKKKQRDYYHASKLMRNKRKSMERECTNCKSPRYHESKLCKKHWGMDVVGKYGLHGNHEKLVALLERQGFRCLYTRTELVPGRNASIDHLLPRSRYPERSSDIDNVAWVDRDINRMKGNKTFDEFIGICQAVASIHTT